MSKPPKIHPPLIDAKSRQWSGVPARVKSDRPLCDSPIKASQKETALSVLEQYRQKRRSAVEALDEVHDGDVVVVPTGVAEPPALLTALSERRRNYRDVTVAQILPMTPFG